MARLHRVSTPKIAACIIACNIAAVESHSTSATLRTTNCSVKHVSHNIARNVAPCVRALNFIVAFQTAVMVVMNMMAP